MFDTTTESPSLHDLHTDATVASSGLPDELSVTGQEMAALFRWDEQPDEDELEAMYQAHLAEQAAPVEPEVLSMPGSRDAFSVLVNGRIIGAAVWSVREGGFLAIGPAGKRVGDLFPHELDAAAAIVAVAG